MNIVSLKSTRLVMALIASGAIGGASVAVFQNVHEAHALPAPLALTAPVTNPTMALTDFSQITEKYGPAVVNISVTGVTKVADDGPVASRGQHDDPFNNDPLFEFFRRFQQGQGQGKGPGQGQGAPRDTPSRGQG